MEKKDSITQIAASREKEKMTVLWDTSAHKSIPSDTVIDIRASGVMV